MTEKEIEERLSGRDQIALERKRGPGRPRKTPPKREEAKALLNKYEQKLVEEQPEVAVRKKKVLKDGDQVFIQCHRCLRPGAFLEDWPGTDNKVSWGSWYSTYKEQDRPYTGRIAPCQCCNSPLKVLNDGSGNLRFPSGWERYVTSVFEMDKRRADAKQTWEDYKARKSANLAMMQQGGN